MRYIKSVLPMPGYRLRMEMESGSTVTIDLSQKLRTAKYAELADEEFFKTATTDGDYVTWGCGRVRPRGLFRGVGDDMFDPNGSMTRAMFVTVLSRLEGIDDISSISSFPDVPSDTWYSEAVAWAAQNGIVGGHDDGTFGPDQPITREQMCTIFLRYLTYKRYSLELIAEKASFGDEGSISSWATDAVSLCQQFGLVLGKPGNVFDPAVNSTRAEACTVFFRLIDAILDSLS